MENKDFALAQQKEHQRLWEEWGLLPWEVPAGSVADSPGNAVHTGVLKNEAPKSEKRGEAFEALRLQALSCGRCRLAQGRTQVVFGEGPKSPLMFVGEAPGQDEDRSGQPFVGRAGQLLTKMIEAMGTRRSLVYVANVVKCRPPENRTPLPDEVESCAHYLEEQIEWVQPEIIIALGATATGALLRKSVPLSRVRGNFYALPLRFPGDQRKIQVRPTFHPAYLLRNPDAKRYAWEDLQAVRDHLKVRPGSTGFALFHSS